MPSYKSSPKFAREESKEEAKAPLKVMMPPKLDHSDSFVGPTGGDNNAVMISEMESPGPSPVVTSLL